jgi:hypothetical protein
MATPVSARMRGVRLCALFLQECLKIGWQKDQLEELENLWWWGHDDTGFLFPPMQSRPNWLQPPTAPKPEVEL